jgi:hypothetical protein
MFIKMQMFIVLVLTFGVFSQAQENEMKSTTPLPFDEATVRFEQNATDGDVEVVFEIKAGDEGLTELKVVSPDGRTIVNFSAPDASSLGIRQFRFESPEPTDIEALKEAYPEGKYRFSAVASDGSKYDGSTKLSHTLPGIISFLNPLPESENVSIQGLKISWGPVENVVVYMVEIDQDELNFNMTLKINGNQTEFMFPDGILVAGKEYTLAIGSVMKNGNSSYSETRFSTKGDNK